MDTKEFIERANKLYGNKYDYSFVEYTNRDVKVKIVCPEHGEFWQTPHNHLNRHECPKCSLKRRIEKRKAPIEAVLQQFRKTHGDKYDYSKVEYVNSNTKVCIICPEHGEFWQTPYAHISGQRCPKCAQQFMDKEYFMECAKKVHKDKYDYSKVEYTNNKTKVCIICPEHGEFWQTPNGHLNGQGCPMCKESHLERNLSMKLKEAGIEFIPQYRGFEWLEKQNVDFYLPEYNVSIECQGEQHFLPNFFKSKGYEYANKHFEYRKSLDDRKQKLFEENKEELIYFFEKKFEKKYTYSNHHFSDYNALAEWLRNRK